LTLGFLHVRSLRHHLTRKGDLTSAERALLVFLKQEAQTPPKCLLDLCAKTGV
jgi:hypothetical protein